MIQKTVAASEVKVGDELYAKSDWHNWFRVIAVDKSESGDVIIKTLYWDTWKHPREGVAIRRRFEVGVSATEEQKKLGECTVSIPL